MAKSKRAIKAQKAQQRNAKQRQAQQFQQVQQSNKNKQVQELRAKYQRVIDQNKAPKSAANANAPKTSTKVSKNMNVKVDTKISPEKTAQKPNFAQNTDTKSAKTIPTEKVATTDKVSTEKSSSTKLRTFAEPRILEKTEISPKTPTLEDWQAKQRQRVEEAYERKQEELKLKEVELELQAEPKKHLWRNVLVACVVLLVVVNAGVGGWILAQNLFPRDEVEVPHVGSIAADKAVDFGQRILAEDGTDFVPTYRLGAAQNLVLKFPDLHCASDCENVQDVMLDDYFLSKNEHSVLNDDGLTIILDSNFLESLAPNNYTLTFELSEGGETKLIGVVLTIEKVELVCTEGQVLQGESCVDEAGNEVAKPTERIINYTENATVTNPNGNQSPSDDNQTTDETPSQPETPETPTTPEKSPEQIACERQIGPTSLTIVHWLSEAEKAEHPNAEVYVMRGGFNIDPQTGAAKMVWVNGICRPAVSQSGYNGNGGYMSTYRAQAVYGDAVSATITNNPGQDVAIWGWKYGRTTTDILADSRVVLGY